MSIDPECDLEWSSRKYLDSHHDKKYGFVGRVSSGEETDSFDDAINALDGNSGCEFIPGPLENKDQISSSYLWIGNIYGTIPQNQNSGCIQA